MTTQNCNPSKINFQNTNNTMDIFLALPYYSNWRLISHFDWLGQKHYSALGILHWVFSIRYSTSGVQYFLPGILNIWCSVLLAQKYQTPDVEYHVTLPHPQCTIFPWTFRQTVCLYTGPTIFVKDVTKEVKKVRLAITKPCIHQPMGKDKGKEKVVAVKEPELYDLPCTKCSDKHKCVIAYGIRGLLVKACGRCFTLKVKCEWPVANTALTDHMQWMMQDVEMSHEANAKQPTHIAAMTPMEPEVDHPAAITSADDFPADHWQEDPDTIIMPPLSPPYFLSPPPHLTEPTILDVKSTVHDWVVALAACVAAMEVAD
ncbi:hypothetical protein BDR04DRAFT_1122052 [Suillus decipiens]|nr:hypothetical protein BDR04DRAFT_1122052 [Suillus decipiens]